MDREQEYADLLEAKKLMNVAFRDDVSQYVRLRVLRAQAYLDKQAGEIAFQILADPGQAEEGR